MGFDKPPGTRPQQGTLFKAPKPTDNTRWPRGYTPERMAEVRQTFPSNRISVATENKYGKGGYGGEMGPSWKERGQLQTRIGKRYNSGEDTAEEYRAGLRKIQRNVTRARVQETIARSTAPMSDMSAGGMEPPEIKMIGGGTSSFSGQYQLGQHYIAGRKTKKVVTDEEGVTHYQRGRTQGRTVERNALVVAADSHTLMHEMGHAADHRLNTGEFMNALHTEQYKVGGGKNVASPRAEGFAEGYADLHNRGTRADRPLTDRTRRYDAVFARGDTRSDIRARYEEGHEKAGAGPIVTDWERKTQESNAASARFGGPQQMLLYSRDALATHTATERDFGQWHQGGTAWTGEKLEPGIRSGGTSIPPRETRMKRGWTPDQADAAERGSHGVYPKIDYRYDDPESVAEHKRQWTQYRQDEKQYTRFKKEAGAGRLGPAAQRNWPSS